MSDAGNGYDGKLMVCTVIQSSERITNAPRSCLRSYTLLKILLSHTFPDLFSSNLNRCGKHDYRASKQSPQLTKTTMERSARCL
jgi:hypothetical protein